MGSLDLNIFYLLFFFFLGVCVCVCVCVDCGMKVNCIISLSLSLATPFTWPVFQFSELLFVKFDTVGDYWCFIFRFVQALGFQTSEDNMIKIWTPLIKKLLLKVIAQMLSNKFKVV